MPGRTVLPSLGVGLSGGCYLHWRGAATSDTSKAAETNKARSWLQRAIRGIELELLRETVPPHRGRPAGPVGHARRSG